MLLFILVSVSPTFSQVPPAQEKANGGSFEPIKQEDRILILAPHPDDEAIGCAGVIQQAIKAKAKVEILYLTNGDHNQFAFIVYEKRLTFKKGEFIHMGELRKKEAIKAMALLGLDRDDLIFLGYPDFGTFTIFSQYWQSKKPFRDLLTRISSVPYKDNLSFGAPYTGESILADLKKVLLDYKPNKIFVSHPADVNPDHKSLYLFLQIALRDLKQEFPQPKIYPYLIHCVGWPLPRHYHPELNLEPPAKFSNTEINWERLKLTPQQLDKKYQAILCYKSQTESSAFYLFSFARKNELFGDYPKIKLEKQVSLKERAVSFFGFSDMFPGSEVGRVSDTHDVGSDNGQVSYAIADDCFLVRLEKTGEFKRDFTFLLFIFGYSDKTPFPQMPKIRIFVKNKRFKMFVNKKRIKSEEIFLESGPHTLTLKIPLRVLGNPDFIVTSLKAYGGILPVDTSSFRKIEIR